MSSALETSVHRYATPIAIVAAVLCSLVLPRGLYVDELFVTFIHEASHALAALLSGGSVDWMTVHADTSGLTSRRGGWNILVMPAGYMGAALWGGALLVASRRRGLEKLVCWFLALFIGTMTLVYTRNLFGFGFGVCATAFFAFVAQRGHGWQLALLLNFLAVRCILNAFMDIRTLLFLSQGSFQATDAANMSRVFTGGLIPPVVFALGIGAASVVALGGFLAIAWKVEQLGAGRDQGLLAD